MERQEAEAAEAAKAAEQAEGYEEGEEEEALTSDAECDVASRTTFTRFPAKPALDLGSTLAAAAQKPEPKAKAKGKGKGGKSKGKGKKDDDASELGRSEVFASGDDGAEVSELTKIVLEDPKLKLLSDALGHVPRCFAALLPSKILSQEGGGKVGHQIKGAGSGCLSCKL